MNNVGTNSVSKGEDESNNENCHDIMFITSLIFSLINEKDSYKTFICILIILPSFQKTYFNKLQYYKKNINIFTKTDYYTINHEEFSKF